MPVLHRAARLLSLAGPAVEDGALLVREDRILDAGPFTALRRAHPGAVVHDWGEAVLLPPLVNAHTHLELTDFPVWAQELGETAPVADFVGWIRRVIRVKRQVAVERFAASIAHGVTQLLACGTGAVGDILSLPHLAAQYRDIALRGRLYLETLGVDAAVTGPAFERLKLQAGQGRTGALEPGLGPHSPYTLSRSYLGAVLAAAAQRRWPVSLHLAESAEETCFLDESAGPIARELYPLVGWPVPQPPAGQRPWPYLRQTGPVDERCLLVHGVHVDPVEAEDIARSGATVVLCPRSNARLGVGTAPVAAYRKAGVPLALGTDSLASNASLSLWEEMAFALDAFGGVLDPETLLRLATRDGARALGLETWSRGLVPGAAASFQVVERPAAAAGGVEALVGAGAGVKVKQLILDGVPRLPDRDGLAMLDPRQTPSRELEKG